MRKKQSMILRARSHPSSAASSSKEHKGETDDAPECKNHGHARDVEREEPGQARDAELDVVGGKVVVEERQAPLDEVLKDALVEDGAVHGRAAGERGGGGGGRQCEEERWRQRGGNEAAHL